MRQLLQDFRSREVRLEEVPAPCCRAGGVLVRSAASLISSGTERSTVALGTKSLVGMGLERPDLVQKLFRRVRTAGIADVVAAVKVGERVAVVGLGLVGLLAAQVLKAAGCWVWGIDLDPDRVRLGRDLGLDFACESRECRESPWYASSERGEGPDAVIVTAATRSAEPIELAGRLARDRGIVVVVGDVRVDIPREFYYKKELQVRYSRSYGPGRYDAGYEERGIDYPYGFVRWTEKRNMEAFLALVEAGKVRVSPLVTHRFAISDALNAYDLLSGKGREKCLAILITYPGAASVSRRVTVAAVRG